MGSLWIWGIASLSYAAFWRWYSGPRRPLTGDEIARHLAIVERSDLVLSPGQLDTLRGFLAADDGREFLMLNLVRVRAGGVMAPGATGPQSGRAVLDGYTRHFMPALFRRAGHPAFFGRAAAGYLEHWGTEADPGWSFGAAIRYRSRRDMIELVTDPRFADAHAFKAAAIETTFAFPTAPGFVIVGPRVWMALAIALVAALVHLAQS